jgi:hypothetical protein
MSEDEKAMEKKLESARSAWWEVIDAIAVLNACCEDPEVGEKLKQEVGSWPILTRTPMWDDRVAFPFAVRGKMRGGGINQLIFSAWFVLKNDLPPLTEDQKIRSLWADVITEYAVENLRPWIDQVPNLSKKIENRATKIAKRDFDFEKPLDDPTEDPYYRAGLREIVMDALRDYVKSSESEI